MFGYDLLLMLIMGAAGVCIISVILNLVIFGLIALDDYL